jgi:hypothetical protein
MPPIPTIGSGVHLRRAILLFALVLGLTALAAGVSPSRDTGGVPAASAPTPPPPKPDARIVELSAGPAGRPALLRARAGENLVLMVSSPAGGLVTIPALGRTATVSPATAARFDLLAPAQGRYDVLFEASGGQERRRVGTLVTRP